MGNLDIYERVRSVPENALKPIHGGRLKGMSNIDSMWRIKTLTDVFGPCGIGWWTEITKQWECKGSNDQISVFCNINLYYIYDGEVSYPIPGTGGASFVAKESGGLHTSDECYKMAYTDAISVAAKSLGIGADVYWGADSSKYDVHETEENTKNELICPKCNKKITGISTKTRNTSAKELYDKLGMCYSCYKLEKEKNKGENTKNEA